MISQTINEPLSEEFNRDYGRFANTLKFTISQVLDFTKTHVTTHGKRCINRNIYFTYLTYYQRQCYFIPKVVKFKEKH